MKIASFAIPMIGGVYSVASRLRQGLAEHGVEMRWIGIGPRGIEAWNEPGMEAERAHGIVVGMDAASDREQAAAVIAYLESERFDGVILDVLGGVLQPNLARYLPEHFFRLLIVHSITPGTYAHARAIRDFVHATVGVSPRVRKDLVRRHGFDPERTHAIPNGCDLSPFASTRRDHSEAVLRVLCLGRVENSSKGVLDIPRIARRLNRPDIRFTIAGDGPDLGALKAAARGSSSSFNFLGAVPPAQVADLMARHDVLLFPSRFEGLGLSLVEAMVTGCVPVASLIRGVTDFVVEDGVTGLLFPVGSIRRAADALNRLADDRTLLDRLSSNAHSAALARFDVGQMAEQYHDVLRTLMASRHAIHSPLALESWHYPAALRPGWRRYVPAWAKGYGRILAARLR
ncbi:glycosyltransferase [Thioalbus denitrificans]